MLVQVARLSIAVILGTVAFVVGSSLSVADEIRVRDDLGNSIILPQSARRIISLAPHITEL